MHAWRLARTGRPPLTAAARALTPTHLRAAGDLDRLRECHEIYMINSYDFAVSEGALGEVLDAAVNYRAGA